MSFDELIDQLLEIYLIFDQKKNKNVLDFEKYKNIKILNYNLNDPKNNNLICIICQNKFIESDKINLLNCQHSFHSICLKKWLLKYNHSCPICRTIVN